MILFLSKYPQTPEEFRDGFYQRVENIDRFFVDDQRTYLSVSFFKNLKKKVRKDENREEIDCNLFLHFFMIFNLFRKSSLVYIQSIYNALYMIGFILLFKKYYVLDLHGVVPEELVMQQKEKHARVFSIIEKLLFIKMKVCIAVTNRMVHHYKSKYPKSKTKYIVYAILPSHLKPYQLNSEIDNTGKIEIIYSGNAQVWQNVDLMLDTIKNNLSDKIHFTILTGDPETFNAKIASLKIKKNQITVKSVKPEELDQYYKKSNYGFVLRDDFLVNQVACPTKIIEYLNYGIIPIVLSEKIGDFSEYGYDYIFLNQLNDRLETRKSEKNIDVIFQLYKDNSFDFKNKIGIP